MFVAVFIIIVVVVTAVAAAAYDVANGRLVVLGWCLCTSSTCCCWNVNTCCCGWKKGVELVKANIFFFFIRQKNYIKMHKNWRKCLKLFMQHLSYVHATWIIHTKIMHHSNYEVCTIVIMSFNSIIKIISVVQINLWQ